MTWSLYRRRTLLRRPDDVRAVHFRRPPSSAGAARAARVDSFRPAHNLATVTYLFEGAIGRVTAWAPTSQAPGESTYDRGVGRSIRSDAKRGQP